MPFSTPISAEARPIQPPHARYADLRLGIAAVIVVLVTAGATLLRLHTVARDAYLDNATHLIGHAATEGANAIGTQFQFYETLHAVTRPILRHSAAQTLPDPITDELLHAANQSASALVRLAVYNADGRSVWSPTGIIPTGAITDRPYFVAITQDRIASAIDPAVLGHNTHVTVIHFAEPIFADTGALLGLSVIAIDPDRLLALAPSGAAGSPLIRTLLRDDGTVIASTAPNPAITAAVNPPKGRQTARISRPDARPPLVATQRIAGTSLTLIVTADEQAVLESAAPAIWRRDLVLVVVTTALLIALAAGMAWFLTYRRTQAREADHRANARIFAGMRMVTDNINDIVSIWDYSAGIPPVCRFMSPSVKSLEGIDLTAMTDRHTAPPLHPDDLPVFYARTAAQIGGEILPPWDARVIDKAGKIRWFQMNTQPIANPADNPNGHLFIAVWREITASKQAEIAAETFRERFENLAANAPGCLYECTATGAGSGTFIHADLQYMTPGFADLTGYPAERFALPSSFGHIAGRKTESLSQTLLRNALAEGEAALEYGLTCADGTTLPVRDRLRVMAHGPEGTTLVGFVTNISDELDLRNRMVETGRLSLLGELAASIAHEINQPLSVIMMRANRLAASGTKKPLSPEAVIRAGEIITAMCDRAANVVASIRDFARNVEAEPIPFDPAAACAAAITIVQPHLRDRPARITVDIANPPPQAAGHIGHYEQVLINLITNAVDAYDSARPGAERRIEITITPRGDRTLTTVTDHAGGIPDKVFPRLYEPFYTTKAAGKGTGLGLAICQRLVTDMGGTLTAHNTEDGACFEINLPQPQAAA